MRLLRYLHHERSTESTKVPILFICHSLGGLVLKQLIVLAGQSPSIYDAIRQNILGLVFLATPHRGSDKANLLSVLTRLSDLLPTAKSTKSYWVKDLKEHSRTVEGLVKAFKAWLEELHKQGRILPIRSFWETERLQKGKIMVCSGCCRFLRFGCPKLICLPVLGG